MIDLLNEPTWFFGHDAGSLPQWFSGYDGYLQLIFAFITILVSIYAFKVYRLSNSKESYFFGLGFFLISLAYSLWAILNLTIVTGLGQTLCRETHICMVGLIVDASIYFYMLLFIVGLLVLTYTTMKTKNDKTYMLLFAIILAVLIFSKKTLFLFYVILSIILFYLTCHHILNYARHRKIKMLLVSAAFALLFLGSLEFVFGISDGVYYVFGNLLMLVGYLLILANLILVMRK